MQFVHTLLALYTSKPWCLIIKGALCRYYNIVLRTTSKFECTVSFRCAHNIKWSGGQTGVRLCTHDEGMGEGTPVPFCTAAVV
jgi:hypothetical protein